MTAIGRVFMRAGLSSAFSSAFSSAAFLSSAAAFWVVGALGVSSSSAQEALSRGTDFRTYTSRDFFPNAAYFGLRGDYAALNHKARFKLKIRETREQKYNDFSESRAVSGASVGGFAGYGYNMGPLHVSPEFHFAYMTARSTMKADSHALTLCTGDRCGANPTAAGQVRTYHTLTFRRATYDPEWFLEPRLRVGVPMGQFMPYVFGAASFVNYTIDWDTKYGTRMQSSAAAATGGNFEWGALTELDESASANSDESDDKEQKWLIDWKIGGGIDWAISRSILLRVEASYVPYHNQGDDFGLGKAPKRAVELMDDAVGAGLNLSPSGGISGGDVVTAGVGFAYRF